MEEAVSFIFKVGELAI